MSGSKVDLQGLNDHRLDAVLCTVAAADFLSGRCIAPRPEQMEAAQKEGWIWVFDPDTRVPD